jgi:hypothetical protein
VTDTAPEPFEFYKMHDALLGARWLSDSARSTAHALLRRVGDDWRTNDWFGPASIGYVHQLTGLALSTISAAATELERGGVIAVEVRPGRPCVYTFHPPTRWTPNGKRLDSLARAADNARRRGRDGRRDQNGRLLASKVAHPDPLGPPSDGSLGGPSDGSLGGPRDLPPRVPERLVTRLPEGPPSSHLPLSNSRTSEQTLELRTPDPDVDAFEAEVAAHGAREAVARRLEAVESQRTTPVPPPDPLAPLASIRPPTEPSKLVKELASAIEGELMYPTGSVAQNRRRSYALDLARWAVESVGASTVARELDAARSGLAKVRAGGAALLACVEAAKGAKTWKATEAAIDAHRAEVESRITRNPVSQADELAPTGTR